MVTIVATLCSQEGSYSHSSPNTNPRCTICLCDNINIIIEQLWEDSHSHTHTHTHTHTYILLYPFLNHGHAITLPIIFLLFIY